MASGRWMNSPPSNGFLSSTRKDIIHLKKSREKHRSLAAKRRRSAVVPNAHQAAFLRSLLGLLASRCADESANEKNADEKEKGSRSFPLDLRLVRQD